MLASSVIRTSKLNAPKANINLEDFGNEVCYWPLIFKLEGLPGLVKMLRSTPMQKYGQRYPHDTNLLCYPADIVDTILALDMLVEKINSAVKNNKVTLQLIEVTFSEFIKKSTGHDTNIKFTKKSK